MRTVLNKIIQSIETKYSSYKSIELKPNIHQINQFHNNKIYSLLRKEIKSWAICNFLADNDITAS